MPELSSRRKTFEAIEHSSIHQSLATPGSHVAMARGRAATLNDPVQAMDILRSLLQPSINEDIKKILYKYVDSHFSLAVRNAKENLGADKVSNRLIDEVCINVLEHAKSIFSADKPSTQSKPKKSKKRKRKTSQDASDGKNKEDSAKWPRTQDENKTKIKPNNDLILVTKLGRPVRREGPKWDPERLTTETLFILGSRANKALGFGQTRGRLYMKHPELFKYSGDQEDKEWLAKNHVMASTGGKAYLMILSDIVDLARSAEYASHPRQQPHELIGFTVPNFMLAKMKRFISVVRTHPSTPEDQLVRVGEEQIAQWEQTRRDLLTNMTSPCDSDETGDVSAAAEMLDVAEDELGFLHGMNLNNLVREFEMEAATAGSGSQHLAILSLADDDDAAGTFPDLPVEEEADESQSRMKEGQKNDAIN